MMHQVAVVFVLVKGLAYDDELLHPCKVMPVFFCLYIGVCVEPEDIFLDMCMLEFWWQ